jgi:uncharacterized protein
MKIQPVSFDYQNKKIGGFLYIPKEDKKLPAVIFVHGFGGGVHKSKNKFMCEKLAENGIVTLMFDFYDCPNKLSEIPCEEMTLTLQLKILKKAIDFVYNLDYVDKDKIGLTGHSLGGMTSLLYTPSDKRIKVLVLQSPAVDLYRSPLFSEQLLRQWKEQGYYNFDKSWGVMKINYTFVQDYKKYDIFKEAEKINIPILMFNGDIDRTTPLGVAKELISHFNNCQFKVIKNGTHLYKKPGTLEQATDLLVEFMKKNLK